ncbi:adenylate kinase family protein [Methanobacterium sp.]|uniref:adenylate kinase family protein n=1 Tax=Methanobacterium sp. TaxID=2164 RepID=UPI002AB8FA7D|nr:adenylate kinase family protein [Methanobacterium sp.]MDY9922481.1 adenylate kinase family protein [Methanobacterium sp.]
MIVLLTGTPGTGKTTISHLLAEKLGCQLVDINHLVGEKHLYTGLDPEKDYKIVDMDALEGELFKIVGGENAGHQKKDSNKDSCINSIKTSCIIIEGHLSHYFPRADLVVVFRTDPRILEERLKKREWKAAKIRENLEAEALDICTWEAHQTHGTKVHEVETTHITPEEAINIISEIINGKKSFPVGNIDFSGYLGV